MQKTAVVILNYNGAKMLRQFLPGVLQYSGFESVIVVDNASTDNSLDVLKYEFPIVSTIVLDQNYGFAGGYNKAIQQIDAEYIVLLNSDVEVTEDWLVPLEDYMDSHPEIAACQPKILSYHNKTDFEYAGACGGFIDKYGYPYCRGRILSTLEKDNGQYDSSCPVFWATGAALMIRKTDYIEAGGLDERFFAHMEEIDLCWRLKSRGRNIVCIPQSRVFHVGGGTLKKENPQKTYLNFRNNLLMLYKNLPSDEIHQVMQVRKYLDFLAWLQFVVKFDWRNANAVRKARKDFNEMKACFTSDRENNLNQCTISVIPERSPRFLLWEYYVKRNCTFDKLHKANK